MAPRKKTTPKNTPPENAEAENCNAITDEKDTEKVENESSQTSEMAASHVTNVMNDEYIALQTELEREREIKSLLKNENERLSQENTQMAKLNSDQAELIQATKDELAAARKERKAEEDVNSSLKDGGVPCTVPGRYRITKGKAFKNGVCHTPDDNSVRVFKQGEIIGKNWEKV